MHADTNERNDHLIQRIVVKVFGLFQMSMNITRKMHSHCAETIEHKHH